MKEFVEKLICRLEECKKIEKCNLYSGIEEGFGYSHCSDAFEDGQTLGAFNAYSNMLDFIKELAEEYNNGWIPVSERLPEESELVLIYAESRARGGSIRIVGHLHNGFWFAQTSSDTLGLTGIGQFDVIAWMELPEKYKEKNNGSS